jgi:hypothetical protein
MNTLHSLGDLALDRVDPDTAFQRFAESLHYAVERGNGRSQVYCIAGIACALGERGDDEGAARLWGMAEDQESLLGFRMLGSERERYERLMSPVRERLGSAYDAACAAGAGLGLERAVAEARRHSPAP